MAKRSRVETALKKARSVLSSYIPGRKRAEATLDEVLRVLGQARGVLRPRGRRRAASRRARGRSKMAPRKQAARRKTGGAAAARKRAARRSAR
jgi:hypothetical protein